VTATSELLSAHKMDAKLKLNELGMHLLGAYRHTANGAVLIMLSYIEEKRKIMIF
jgi:hypothetical protein